MFAWSHACQARLEYHIQVQVAPKFPKWISFKSPKLSNLLWLNVVSSIWANAADCSSRTSEPQQLNSFVEPFTCLKLSKSQRPSKVICGKEALCDCSKTWCRRVKICIFNSTRLLWNVDSKYGRRQKMRFWYWYECKFHFKGKEVYKRSSLCLWALFIFKGSQPAL